MASVRGRYVLASRIGRIMQGRGLGRRRRRSRRCAGLGQRRRGGDVLHGDKRTHRFGRQHDDGRRRGGIFGNRLASKDAPHLPTCGTDRLRATCWGSDVGTMGDADCALCPTARCARRYRSQRQDRTRRRARWSLAIAIVRVLWRLANRDTCALPPHWPAARTRRNRGGTCARALLVCPRTPYHPWITLSLADVLPPQIWRGSGGAQHAQRDIIRSDNTPRR